MIITFIELIRTKTCIVKQIFLLYHVKFKCSNFLATKHYKTRNNNSLGLAQQLRPRHNHTYNFWAIGKLVLAFLQLYSYLSGNSLGAICLFINSTRVFQSFPVTNFTGFLQPDDGPFSTGRKYLKGGSVMY